MTVPIADDSSDLSLLLTTISIASLTGVVVWHHIRFLSLLADRAESPASSKELPPGESNLWDQYSYTAEGESPAFWKVKSLWIYPLKSCHGIELNESRVVSTGLEHDRQYTLAEKKVDPKTGREGWVFITQRQYPLLARVTTKIKPKKNTPGGSALEVGYPVKTWLNRWLFMGDEVLETFELPLDADELELSKYPLESVRIWKEFVEAHNMGVLLPHGLAKAVGAKNPVTLFRMPPAHPRSVFRCAPTKDEVGYQPMTAFADAYPIHLINLASVRDLNKKIQDSIPELSAIRFRPNIILSGPPAFEEDSWRRISVGNGIYYTSCRTVRCKMPNVNQETGEQHPTEPDRTMRKYRCIDVGNKFNACMGMQVVPAAESGVIRVGDRITVLETGEHCYIDQ